MGEETKQEQGESRAYRVIFGSVKMFVFLYLVIIAAILAGFTVLEPLFSTLGAVVLFGVSFTTYVLES